MCFRKKLLKHWKLYQFFFFFFIFFSKPGHSTLENVDRSRSKSIIRRLKTDLRVKVSPILQAGTNVNNPVPEKIGNINNNIKQENAASSDTSNITNKRGVSNLDGGSPEQLEPIELKLHKFQKSFRQSNVKRARQMERNLSGTFSTLNQRFVVVLSQLMVSTPQARTSIYYVIKKQKLVLF